MMSSRDESEKLEKKVFGCLIAAVLFGLLAYWGTVIYIVQHFVRKYW